MSNSPTSAKAVGISIAIRECKCTDFFLTEFANENQVEISSDKYGFNLNINFRMEHLEKTILVEIASSLFNNSEKKEIIAEIKSRHTFFVTNFDEISVKTEKGVEIPQQVMPPLIAMGIANLRGMFSVKLENTIYSNAVLPIIDTNNMTAKPVTALG